MNKHPKNLTSRRQFLKKSGQVAVLTGVAAAVGHRAGTTAQAQPSTPARPAKPRRPDATTNKLAKEIDTPDRTFPKLGGTRPPGWRPDTADKGGERLYFPEEAIHFDKKKNQLTYFPTPQANKIDFDEPGTPDQLGNISYPETPDHRVAFNRWMLGDFTPPNPNEDQTFFNFLVGLADQVRRYNAALYWLRTLHFTANDTHQSPAPPPNPHGPKVKPGETPADSAQGEWQTQVRVLNEMLNDGVEFINIMADMVEVNGYIVSMRIVCDPARKQIGGSSSSHISISSAFSSRTP